MRAEEKGRRNDGTILGSRRDRVYDVVRGFARRMKSGTGDVR